MKVLIEGVSPLAKRLIATIFVLTFVVGGSDNCVADEIERDLKAIAAAGPMGIGSKQARAARDRLVSRGVAVLPRLLTSTDTANPVAANWYRSAYQRIVSVESRKDRPQFPIKYFKLFVRDSNHQGRVRRLVLQLLDQREPGFRDELIPRLLDDREFRTDAVAAALKRGDSAQKQGKTNVGLNAYQTAFEHARDVGQITLAARKLRGLGRDVSIIKHMGFVIDWYLIGPFDAPGTTGFELLLPPEKKIDLKAQYDGKDGRSIRWKRYRTDDPMGQLNLIRTVAQVKEAVCYAYTELESPKDQPVQVRCGADDNCTIWLNGELIFRRLQWLNGTRLDRFTADARLKKGTNRLLVKVCQGPQHKNPAVPNNWSMQLRFCDSRGTGVVLKSLLPPLDN